MRLTGLWWWIDRWRKSTAYMDMTLEQQGAYRNLLDEAALRGGPIPNDERVLAKACGDATRWRKVRDVVLSRFVLTDEGWRNETLEEVIARSRDISDRRSAAGKSGNDKRWHRKPVANDIATDVAKPIAPDPYPDPYKNKNIHTQKFAPRLSDAETATPEVMARAGELLNRYAELFYLHRKGARYHNRMHLDFDKALGLVRTWDDDKRLEKLAVIVLTTDDEWISRTDRGFGIFAARASWADDRLSAWEAEQQVKTS